MKTLKLRRYSLPDLLIDFAASSRDEELDVDGSMKPHEVVDRETTEK